MSSRPTLSELFVHALTNEKKALEFLAYIQTIETSFNGLLQKMDSDTGIADNDFETELSLPEL